MYCTHSSEQADAALSEQLGEGLGQLGLGGAAAAHHAHDGPATGHVPRADKVWGSGSVTAAAAAVSALAAN